MKKVALIAYPHTIATSITLPAEILTAACQQVTAGSSVSAKLSIQIVTTTNQPISSTSGLPIVPSCRLEDLTDLDLIILPSMWRNPRRIVKQNKHLLPLLRHYQQQGTLICAVGTGAYFLGAAGLLDDKPATTHWFYFADFAKTFPAIKLQTSHIITKSDNLYCAGSINAVADLSSHFIEHFYGPAIARLIEGQFSPEIRRSYRSYGYFEGETNTHQDEQIADIQQWLHDNYQHSISIKQVADDAQINPRTLNRRFTQATGKTPSRYLLGLRLNQAKELLRQTNLSIGEIATNVSYEDYSYFSALFKQHIGFTPREYRVSIQGKLFKTTVS
jgi:transcriptional regulator GlxA family with amidase domain